MTFYDEKGRRNPKWTYVHGRNEHRGKVSFQKDDFEDSVDTWVIMAKPGEGPPQDGIDTYVAWNAEQEKASTAILKKLRSIKGLEGKVKKTTMRGLQAHVERRLWEGTPARRKHQYQWGGIQDNLYPEEIVPLRNPKKSEPVVAVAVQRAIFPPDDDKPNDGEKAIRSDEVRAPIPNVQ